MALNARICTVVEGCLLCGACCELTSERHLAVHQVGGDSMEAQFAELAGNPDVIVATPGRLAHHLTEVAGFGLKTVEYVVFDEADRWVCSWSAGRILDNASFVCGQPPPADYGLPWSETGMSSPVNVCQLGLAPAPHVP